MSNTIYCTYLTIYSGNKLPPFYIGSSSEKKVKDGYHGSVKSKKYKSLWNNEIKNNPSYFKTKIISKHSEKKDALEKERQLQKQLNVIKNSMYINESIASPNGFFGRDVSGKLNPNYGNKLSEEMKRKIGEANRKHWDLKRQNKKDQITMET